MSLAKTALRGTIWLTIGQYVSSTIAILGNIWLARILGPEPFGVFFVVSSFTEILFLLGSFSFAQYVVQAPIITRGHYHAVMAFSSALSLSLVLVAGIVLWALSDQYPPSLLVLFFLLSISRAAWSVSFVFTYLLERAMAYRSLAISRIIAVTTGVALSLGIAYNGGEVWSFLGREAGMVVAGTIAAWIISRRISILSSDMSVQSPYREVWNFGFRLSGVQLLEQAFHRIDGLLLGRVLGLDRSADLGYYAQAKYLANIPNVAVDAGTRTVAYRVFAVVREDSYRLQRTIDMIQFWAVRAIMPIALLFFSLPDDTLHWVLGPQWTPAGAVLQSLSCFTLFLVLFNNLKMVRLTLHDWKGLYWTYGIQFVAYLIAMVIGVNTWGIIGGAVAYTLANLVGLIAIAWRRDVYPHAMLHVRTFASPLIAASLAAISVHFVLKPSVTAGEWIGSVLLALALYALIWFGLEGKMLLRSIREIKGLVWA